MITDDRLKPENGVYPCYLFAPGVIRTGTQFPLQFENERSPRSLQDAFYLHYSQVHHIVGTSWFNAYDNPFNSAEDVARHMAGAASAGGVAPVNRDNRLDFPGNFVVAYEDPRMLPIMRVDVKSSLSEAYMIDDGTNTGIIISQGPTDVEDLGNPGTNSGSLPSINWSKDDSMDPHDPNPQANDIDDIKKDPAPTGNKNVAPPSPTPTPSPTTRSTKSTKSTT